LYEVNGFHHAVEIVQEIAPTYRPYPKPTLVDAFKRTKALERRVLKELGKMSL